MANGVFNVAKGRVAHLASLPAAADALVVVLLVGAGLEADATLNNHRTLAALLAATNDEATATNYARKVVTTGVTVTIDDVNDRVDYDMPDPVWAALGGAVNNAIAKLIVCYDGDTAAGTDADVTPLTFHDFVIQTDGSDVTAVIDPAGFARSA